MMKGSPPKPCYHTSFQYHTQTLAQLIRFPMQCFVVISASMQMNLARNHPRKANYMAKPNEIQNKNKQSIIGKMLDTAVLAKYTNLPNILFSKGIQSQSVTCCFVTDHILIFQTQSMCHVLAKRMLSSAWKSAPTCKDTTPIHTCIKGDVPIHDPCCIVTRVMSTDLHADFYPCTRLPAKPVYKA